MADDAFSLLARPIQQALWDMGWEALRPIQEEGIRELSRGDRDVIIAARTAAGKTEAAFLPILSQVFEQPQPSVQAVYVGPLRALINDQFRRLEELCRRAEIPVHRWHGDVSGSKKKALLRKPSGVLLITPESIESLFINHSSAIPRLVQHLSNVVIDEIHALVGSERGTHLRSLLYRLGRNVAHEFRTVGLSATLGGAFDEYKYWMCPNRPESVCVISDAGEKKRILYRVHAYATGERASDDAEDGLPDGIVEEMYDHMAGAKNLLFANSKQDVEWFADSLNRRCQQLGRPKEFLVHHGSLSREIREFTEQKMQGRRPQTTACSSTLELGIDIGNVTAVGQVDPPWSVSSLVQRLGRSGRGEDEPQCMRVYVRETKCSENSSLEKRLYPSLLRTIAITELMLETPSWVEPPTIDLLDFSTLTQQILSVLGETGGASAADVFERLVVNGAFQDFDQTLFAALLRSLAQKHLVEQMDGGDLILSPDGESVVNHYSFYSAFATAVEYSVLYASRPIGNLPALYVPRPGDHFILGGRRWQTIEVDDDRREILVQPARGRKPPKFLGGGGEIHPKVRQRMREVLLGQDQYPYLNKTAVELLHDARTTAIQCHLGTNSLAPIGDTTCMWFPWTGTRIQRTLCLLAESVGLGATDRGMAIEIDAGLSKALAKLRQILDTDIDAIALAKRIPCKQTRKFDEFVTESLLEIGLAHDVVDLEGALEAVRSCIITR